MSQILEPGTMLAERYRIIRLIGVGGMGAVFEAENVITHKRVAVKWLQPLIADKPESAQRLVREAQAASRVRHPNVVDVYDVVRDGDTLFLVLELLEGEPLEHVFERESLPLPDLLRVLAQAMRGVAAAHKEGVIHRDLHPGNIFITRQPDSDQYVAKVLDFGISKFTGGDSMSITQPGMTMGTPLYMSFEQLRGEPDIDSRADVYSFGVIVYEALTGRLPFEASSLPELAIKFATSVPSSVRSLRPAIPETLDRAIATALARDRDKRLPNMEALIREVEAFAAVAASRSRSAEDLLGLTDERQPHQIVTLGRQNKPLNLTPAASTSEGSHSGLTWTVTLIGAVAAAGLSAWLVVSMRDRPSASPRPRADISAHRNVPAPPREPSNRKPTVQALTPTPENRRFDVERPNEEPKRARPSEPTENTRSARRSGERVAPKQADAPSEQAALETTAERARGTEASASQRASDVRAEKRRGERTLEQRAQPTEVAPTPAAPAAAAKTDEETVFRAGRPPSREDF